MQIVPPWRNRDLVLYHGTMLRSARNIYEHGVDVRRGKPDRDFGQGFYCTTLITQAAEWAQIKADRSGDDPAIIRFDIPRNVLSKLSHLAFVVADDNAFDYWSFVQFCRSGGVSHGRSERNGDGYYDVVYGPIAVNWISLRPRQSSDQISFHTTAAQRVLNIEAERRIL